MKKLTLDLESLDVQSFEAVDEQQENGGTVFARSHTDTGPECCYTFGCGDSINVSC
ncbi:MAG TPA: hypothetical protein VF771_05830 [Longimicrobiaceae bacterium]